MNKYLITIKEVGKGEKFFTIIDAKGERRITHFSTKKAAEEACFIIEQLRQDTAFQYVRIVMQMN